MPTRPPRWHLLQMFKLAPDSKLQCLAHHHLTRRLRFSFSLVLHNYPHYITQDSAAGLGKEQKPQEVLLLFDFFFLFFSQATEVKLSTSMAKKISQYSRSVPFLRGTRGTDKTIQNSSSTFLHILQRSLNLPTTQRMKSYSHLKR